jgi:hypothetical protein
MIRGTAVRAGVFALAASMLIAAPATARPSPPAQGSTTEVTGSTACDPIDAGGCMLPFPNDRYTVPADTVTGRRVALPAEGMPTNVLGVPVDPAAWGANDGFSPGSMLLADVPGVDLQVTFGLPAGVQVLDRPAVSLAADAPIVLLDLDTGERVPYYAEVDAHPGAVASGERLLIVRPLENLHAGHRYGVALRSMRDADGAIIAPDPVFAWYRGDRRGGMPDGVEPARTAEFQRLFRDLRKAGVGHRDLHLAWSFTVASDDNIAGRALHIRDQAFAELGDADLADGVVTGEAPSYFVTNVVQNPDARTLRRVEGRLRVPNFLATPANPQLDPRGDVVQEALLQGTVARFLYASDDPGPTDLPVRNAQHPNLSVPFVCNIPSTATADAPADPMLYGHGLLGTRTQANGFSTALLRERNFAPCGVDFTGMSTFDQPNVIATLQDMSGFGRLADRLQQGLLNFQFVGRALSHPGGLAADPRFQDAEGAPLIDVDTLSYTGISQGGILGGAVVALAPDLTNGVIDVTGINYSTLLNRSVDWEGAAVGNLYYGYYRDPAERQLGFALMQMLWDRGEGSGYARRTTHDPLPNTPPHNLLMHVAFGDYQVANVAAEVHARSAGARLLQTSLADGRHWSDDPSFGLATFDVAGDGSILPHTGSALVYFDSGNDVPPSVNLPPRDAGGDPHSDPRGDLAGTDQRATFLRTGTVVDVYDGEPYWTQVCRGAINPNC